MRIFGKKDIIYTQNSDSGDLDAFQRQRVSNPVNLFSSTNLEFILAPNTNYNTRIQNDSNETATITYRVHFYELNHEFYK